MQEMKRISNIVSNAEIQLEDCRGETLELYKIHVLVLFLI